MADYKFSNGGSVSTAPPAGANNTSNVVQTTIPKRVVYSTTRRAGKSGKVKHIQDERDRDGISDGDAELTLAELELLREGHDQATSRSGENGPSRGDGPRQKTLEPGMSDVSKHRGRPIKAHEKEPFLSVSAQGGRKSQTYESGNRPKSHTIRTNRSDLTPSSQGPLSAFRSPYSSPTPSIGGFSIKSHGRRSPGKMYVSPNLGSPHSNAHVKMPFKHSVKQPASTEQPGAQSPAHELKEMTALATYHVTRILGGGGGGDHRKKNGRLLKGRLKPLYPVNISGPSIRQCRGIISESRTYSPSVSRTLQRRRQLLAHLRSGEKYANLSGTHLNDGAESVHRVSAASSIAGSEDITGAEALDEAGEKETTEDREFQEELTSMEKDALANQEMEDAISLPDACASSLSREGTASVSAKSGKAGVLSKENTTLGPQSVLSLDKGLVDLPDPDFSSPAAPLESSGQGEGTATSSDTVFLTQAQEKGDNTAPSVDTGSQDNAKKPRHEGEVQKSSSTVSAKTAKHSSRQNESGDIQLLQRENNNMHVNNANNNFISDSLYRRPESAVLRPKSAGIQYEESDFPKSEGKTRPKTAVSVTKAVRFAEQTYASDGSEIPLTVSASWINETTEKKNEKEDKETKTTRASCKPSDSDKSQSRKKDDDNGDEGGTQGGKENKPPAKGNDATVASSKSNQSSDDGNNKDSGTSSGQGQDRTSLSSLTPSPISLFAGRSASASALSVQSIRLTEADSRAESLSELSLRFVYRSPSPPPTAPVSKTAASTPAPLLKLQPVQWTPGGTGEGGVKAPRPLVPDGAGLLQLLLEVASRTGEPSASLSQSSVTHLTDCPSLMGVQSDTSASGSANSNAAVTHSDSKVVAQNQSDATVSTTTDTHTPSEGTGTSTDVTTTNSEMSLPCSITPSRSSTDHSEEAPTPTGPSPSQEPPQSAESEAAKLALVPHAPNAARDHDTLSTRVSVTFCKHDDSQDKNKTTCSSQPPQEEASIETTKQEMQFDAQVHNSPRQQQNSRRRATRKSPERKPITPKGVDDQRRYQAPNTLSELYTHFSLGFGTDVDHGDAQLETSGVLSSGSKGEKQDSGKDKAMEGERSRSIPGILKNKIPVSPGSFPHSLSASARSKLFKPGSSQLDMLAAELGCAGDQQLLYESSVDCQTPPGQPKTKGPKGMRQIYTHHSDKPFVYPSDDPFSSGVAIRLKYGDSPYLKQMKLPKQRSHPRRPMEKFVQGKPADPRVPSCEQVKNPSAPGTPQGGQKTLLKRPRQTRVKFADYSVGALNINHSCSNVAEDGDMMDEFEVEEEGFDARTLALCYPQGDRELMIHSPDHGASGEEDDTDIDDLAARFSALEAELSAVRCEIQGQIVDSQYSEEDDQLRADADNNDDVDDDNFVYEDDGSSDENDDGQATAETDAMMNEEEKSTGEERDASDEDDDGMEQYSSYYRDLLLAYRLKCMAAGEGNLVISDKLTWPCAHASSTPDHTADATPDSNKNPQGKGRPKSASHVQCTKSHAHASLQNRCDSGLGSDEHPDTDEQLFHRADSMQSVDSALSGHSSRCAPPPAQVHCVKQDEGGVRGNDGRTAADSSSTPQLEVIAAPVPKPKGRSLRTILNAPVAPFPPLCFAVNARPPPGTLFFFTYATYMNPDRLGSLLKRQVHKRYWAILFGFELAFNKKGSEEENGGFANIVFNPFASVEGCIFNLTPSELEQLDGFTNSPEHYTRVVLPVWMSEVSGSQSDLDLARYCVPAVTYIAQDNHTFQGSASPNEFEASQCLKSADILTPSYCDHLRSFTMMTPQACLQPTAS